MHGKGGETNISVQKHIYIYISTCTYMYIFIIYMNMYICTYIYIYTDIHVCVGTESQVTRSNYFDYCSRKACLRPSRNRNESLIWFPCCMMIQANIFDTL